MKTQQDRWFTTTGAEKAQTARSAVVLQPENRTTTTREYFGNAGDREGEEHINPDILEEHINNN